MSLISKKFYALILALYKSSVNDYDYFSTGFTWLCLIFFLIIIVLSGIRSRIFPTNWTNEAYLEEISFISINYYYVNERFLSYAIGIIKIISAILIVPKLNVFNVTVSIIIELIIMYI